MSQQNEDLRTAALSRFATRLAEHVRVEKLPKDGLQFIVNHLVGDDWVRLDEFEFKDGPVSVLRDRSEKDRLECNWATMRCKYDNRTGLRSVYMQRVGTLCNILSTDGTALILRDEWAGPLTIQSLGNVRV